MHNLPGFFRRVLWGVPRLIFVTLFGWLTGLIALFISIVRRQRFLAEQRKKRRLPPPYLIAPAGAYARPDPLLYSQPYLRSLGLAVTWENPDIQLRLNGAPVSLDHLQPNTEYEVVARIWNAATEAPAIGVPVKLAFCALGVNSARVPVAETQVDLPVKGAPGLPVLASFRWRTPAMPGVYCPLVEVSWPDDANPQNNIGYLNVIAHSLSAAPIQLQLPVRNDQQVRRSVQLEADSYRIPAPLPPTLQSRPKRPTFTLKEAAQRLQALRGQHAPTQFPIPPGWQVSITPNPIALEPGQEQEVAVEITTPQGFHGRQALNINALDGNTLIGGVTVFMEG